MRTNGDDDDRMGRATSPPMASRGAHDDIGDPMSFATDGRGLSAKADAAGFSPVRFNKSRQHTLDVDPRTKLKIISVPADKRVSFADLQDVVLHIFFDCYKITSGEQHVDRVLIVTDQTLLLCSKDGSCSRCVMVDRVKSLSVTNDKRALAIQVPSEYDIILKFLHPSDRDRVITVLRAVFRRMTHGRLPVETVKGTFDPKAFNIKKPPNFRLSLIPQRTRDQLRQALEAFEQEEEQMLEELDIIQEEMQARHQANMVDMQSELNEKIAKYKDIANDVWDNDARLKKLREDVTKSKRLIEEVDGPFGADGELPKSKDSEIAELELVVARLNAAVYVSGSDQLRREHDDKMASTYFQRDLQEQLYQPTWPGNELNSDLQSLSRALTEKLAAQQKEIDALNDVLEEEDLIEARLRVTKEKIALMRQQLRSELHRRKAATGGDGGGGGSGAVGGGASHTGGAQMEYLDKEKDWLQALPQEISLDTIQYDPRTSLRFVDVPPALATQFGKLSGRIIHFFSVVRKQQRNGDIEKRIFFITDIAIFLATLNSDVKRYIEVGDIDEIVLETGTTRIGFRSSAQYDLVFSCATHDHRSEIVQVLQKIYNYHTNGRSIKVLEIERHQRIEAFLTLQPPADFRMPTIRMTSKEELINRIRERRDVLLHNAPITLSAGDATKPADIHLSDREYADLRRIIAQEMELHWRQDPALVQLRAQLDNTARQSASVSEECTRLKRLIDEHKCEDGVSLSAGSFPIAPGAGIKPSTGEGTYHPAADGLFFIKVDPVQLNCELDVLELTFNNDFLFTGHANGFVNIWDLDDSSEHEQAVSSGILGTNVTGRHRLLRTLREHTGKITDFVCNPAKLYTSSTDGTVRIWELKSGRCVTSMVREDKGLGMAPPRSAVNAISMDDRDKRLVSGGADTYLCVWDVETQRAEFAHRGHTQPILDLVKDGNFVVSIDWGRAHFWDLRTGKVVASVQDSFGGLSCVDYCDYKAVFGTRAGDLAVWDHRKGVSETICGHKDDVLHVQMAGRSCISSSGDYTIKMWDTGGADMLAMKSLGNFNESHPFETKCFRMEGRRFIAGQGQFVKIWSK